MCVKQSNSCYVYLPPPLNDIKWKNECAINILLDIKFSKHPYYSSEVCLPIQQSEGDSRLKKGIILAVLKRNKSLET